MKESQEEPKEAPKPPENWDRCHAFLERKNRFCRQAQCPASLFCGNHRPSPDVSLSKDNGTQRKRVPCPVDPSHCIFQDRMEKHIKVCPRVKKQQEQTKQRYYRENINTGGHGDLFEENNQPGRKRKRKTGFVSLEEAQKLALRILQVHQILFPPPSTVAGNEDKTNEQSVTWEQLHDSIPLVDLSEAELQEGIAEAFQENRVKSGGARHIPQLASLVGHLRNLQILPPIRNQSTTRPIESVLVPVTFLEMGAGRGMLGLTAAGVAAANNISTQLVMVERTGARSKADKVFRNNSVDKEDADSYLKLDAVKWSRIDCDLAHVDLPTVLGEGSSPSEEKKRIVVIAKHLCGAGTDLALKSLESIKEKIHSCLLATCCHGLCDWEQYVGRQSLQMTLTTDSLQFGPAHFELMRRWCAASVAGQEKMKSNAISTSVVATTEDDDYAEHPISNGDPVDDSSANTRVNISAVVESLQLKCGIEGLGRACQRLIDYGRLKYMSEVIFKEAPDETKLIHYVPPYITPQNACLIGRRR